MNSTDCLAFLRFSVDRANKQPLLSDIDWDALYTFSKQQAITGVVFDMVQLLGGKDAGVPRQLLLRWFNQSERIHKRNEIVNQRVVQLIQMFEKNEFNCCLLKGQGNALMYPNPLVRIAGDIDLIIIPQNLSGLPKDEEDRRNVIMAFVRKVFPKALLRYQHVDFPVIKGVPVELHFLPCAMNNPLYHCRLQQWFGERMELQCQNRVELPGGVGSVPVPTVEFNIVYQLAHMMHHFFDEGIGLRQMMDYYYLLQRFSDVKLKKGNEELGKTLRYLNLHKFASAVMYVMREAFGLSEDKMIVPVDERRGKTLMAEILRGGNFGHHSGLTGHSVGVKYFLKHWRNLHFVCEYPSEALCEPIFRTWHFFWRLRHK